MRPKTAESIDMPFGLFGNIAVTLQLRHQANAFEPFICCGDAAFLSNYFDHLLLGRIAVGLLRTYRCGLLLPTE